MIHKRPIALLAAVIVSTAIGLALTPTALAGDGIRTYPTCGASDPTPNRDDTCVQGDLWGGVLIATREDLKYRICVSGPGGDRCDRKKARQGKPSTAAFLRDTVGTYRLTWKAHGRVVDTDRVHLRSEGV
jgi:hypothetical protein